MSRLPENLAHHLMNSKNIKPELDTNPALGVMLRMQIIAMQRVDGKKTYSATESPASLFDKFLRGVERFDAALLGNAKQSWGAFLGGNAGNDKGSTAAKPTKDAKFFNSGMADLSELFDIFDLLLLAMGDKIPGDLNGSLAAKKAEIFKKWQEAKSDPRQIIDLRDKLKEIKEELEARKKEEERRRTRVIAHKFKVPGKTDMQDLRYSIYFVKATNGLGMFALSLRGGLAFNICTSENRLFPLEMPGVQKDQILPRYPGGCTYEYVGDDGLFPYLPIP